MFEGPRVSVLLPVWNGEAFLEPALESILRQTFSSFELIVIDDGSTDASAAIAGKFERSDDRVRVMRRAHEGLAAALNAGIAAARGEYIARMDADDISLPDRLRKQVDYLDAHPACVAAGSWIEVVDEAGLPLGVKTFRKTNEQISAALFRGISPIAHLESAQLPSGEIPIEMSPTPEMSGDCVRDPVVFPAALAARALSITPSAARVRSRALDFLQREMEPGGLWRYPSTEHAGHDDYIPLDVDDTSIASAALESAGRPVPNNRALLLANRNRRGLFRTWIVRWWPHPRRTYDFFRLTTANMGDVDAAIEANVVFYLGNCEQTRPAIAHMLAVLRANGEMMSTKWYESRFTVWYFFSHALREIAPEAGEMIVPRIEAATPRNALDLALAASALLLWNRTPDVQPLLDAQLPSGGWPRAAFYHAGLKRISPNEFQPTPPWWGSEALTTVLAVEALSRRIA